MRTVPGQLRGLVLACHPAPTVTVTIAVTTLAAAAGASSSTCVLVALAVLVGQLSVGWSNDALDAPRDLAVDRRDKPVVMGLVSRRLLGIAACAALATSVVLSFAAAGLRGGAFHVLFLASAWVYNLGVKSTRFSLLPYAVGFGALPGFVTFALDPPGAPQPWALVAAGLLGVGAGLANAAADVEDDRATGVDGAVGRIGARASRGWCVVVLIVASVVLTVGAGLPAVASVAFVATTVIVAVAALVLREGRLLFPVVLLIALADVAFLAANASVFS